MAGWPLDTLLVSTKKAEVLSQVVSRHHTQRDEIYYAVRMDTVTMSKNPFDHKDQKLKKGTLC